MDGMKRYPDGYFDLAVVDPIYGDVPYGGYMSNTGGGIAGPKDYHNAIWEQDPGYAPGKWNQPPCCL